MVPGEVASSSHDGTAPADDYGFPMVSSLVERVMPVDITEVYSPPRVTEEAKKFGPKAGEAWDLAEGWDFTKKEHQDQARRYQKENEPIVLIGSPPPHAHRSASCRLLTQIPPKPRAKEQRASST